MPFFDRSGSVHAERLKQQGRLFPLFIFEMLTSTRRLRVSGFFVALTQRTHSQRAIGVISSVDGHLPARGQVLARLLRQPQHSRCVDRGQHDVEANGLIVVANDAFAVVGDAARTVIIVAAVFTRFIAR